MNSPCPCRQIQQPRTGRACFLSAREYGVETMCNAAPRNRTMQRILHIAVLAIVLAAAAALAAPLAHGAENAAPPSHHPDQTQAKNAQAEPLAAEAAHTDNMPENSSSAKPEQPAPQPEAAAPTHAETRQAAENTPGALPPLRQMITSPFGPRSVPGWLSRRGMTGREHAGLDIRARIGWPVTAFKGGEILHAGESGPLGIAVDIRQDDGMTARYGHLGKTLVVRGQHVKTGDAVGLTGCTGRTTGAHLHFGLRDASGKPVDPEPYLERAEQVLRPTPDQIPAVLEAQSCGPVLRGPDGRPRRLGAELKQLDNYTPPPIPAWNERR